MSEVPGIRDLDSGSYQSVEPKERWTFGYCLGTSQIVLIAYGVEFRFMTAHVVRAGLMKPEWLDTLPAIDSWNDNKDEIAIVKHHD